MNFDINKKLEIYESKLEKNLNAKNLSQILADLKSLEKEFIHNYKIYYLLGNVFWKMLQIDSAIFNYNRSLKLNPNFIKANEQLLKVKREKMDLITYLMYHNPNSIASNSIIKCHQLLQNIKYNILFDKKIDDNLVINLYNKIQNIIIAEDLDPELEVSQIHRDGVVKYNSCDRHFEVFNTFNVIPQNCFSCYKVQLQPKNVFELIKVYLIFDNLVFSKNLTRKCMVELRQHIKGFYKAFIYCVGLEEAEKTLAFIKPILSKTISNEMKIEIKRGCSEFANEYPDYKEINPLKKNFMNYNNSWIEKENIIDQKIKKTREQNFISLQTLSGITLKDAFVINNWLYYAKLIGDTSYKIINKKPNYSEYINKKLNKDLINSYNF